MSTVEDEVLYKGGHKCMPNGVGDYIFVCPTEGEKPGFVPYMYRTLLNGTCKCGEKIELEKEKTNER